ncbi:hypothetical protein QC761_606070 [Podospora bellae-mahoneyi]|uniref:Cyclin n=1 Tax=Podospora bellae-mahoneyi TaxID=2093777 RepID=A0ABR0FAD0_9PEZI|nr:hypothetical protein QC761_606070 [Podospora bellae-mahoneyi]
MATYSPEYSDDEYDFDEEYFAQTYKPLSNLPTPPPSSRDSLIAQSPRSLLEDGGLADSVLLGPAVHLVNLVPPTASLAVPSVALVHEILVRADLPMDTIGLAVCILDSLSSKFSLNWRLLCPLAQRGALSELPKRHTLPVSPVGMAQLHIDCVGPEIIVLTALIIAVKFLEDCQEPTQYYASAWGKNQWTCDQINVTERCIMESLGYRILPLWDPVLIGSVVKDMERAGRQALYPPQPRKIDKHQRSQSEAVTGLGLPLTPAETPVLENGPAVVVPLVDGGKMHVTFGGEGAPAPDLHLPRGKRKTFPTSG